MLDRGQQKTHALCPPVSPKMRTIGDYSKHISLLYLPNLYVFIATVLHDNTIATVLHDNTDKTITSLQQSASEVLCVELTRAGLPTPRPAVSAYPPVLDIHPSPHSQFQT